MFYLSSQINQTLLKTKQNPHHPKTKHPSPLICHLVVSFVLVFFISLKFLSNQPVFTYMLPKVNANVSMDENISPNSSLLFSSLTSLKFTALETNRIQIRKKNPTYLQSLERPESNMSVERGNCIWNYTLRIVYKSC